MGFYLRKSVRVGPLRFNLSKSGIGMSTGIKGFRVGTGPRGNYVHMGRGGIYYRASLGSGGSPVTPSASPPPRPVVVHTDGMTEIESGDVLQMVDASSTALVEELNQKMRRWRLWPWAAILGFFAIAPSANLHPYAPLVVLVVLAVAVWWISQWDALRVTTVLMYDLDDAATARYQKFHDAFDVLMSAGRVGHIGAQGGVTDRKRNAGAGSVVRRQVIRPHKGAPRRIRTNIEVPAVPVGRQTLHFFPDRVLVIEPAAVGAVPYEQLKISVSDTRFIENEGVPSDAKVVGRTWQYVNKNGGPDRRFKNNRELPIALYEEIHFTSVSGLNEVIQVSRTGTGTQFESARQTLATALDTPTPTIATGGQVAPQDEAQAVLLFRKAAEAGNATAQQHLGAAYASGRGVSRDPSQAVRWFRKAAEQNDATAQFKLGVAYATGDGVDKDEARAFRWFHQAAEQGVSEAQCYLGEAYANGRGVPRDYTEAIKWHRRAAEQGHAVAQSNLGFAYANGRGVEKDDAEAMLWYRKAAEQGLAEAEHNLGVRYGSGQGVPQDYSQAAQWYLKAAEQGQPAAQSNLGVLYVEGRGVPQDYAKALFWYRKAADQGQGEAQCNLGEMYANGHGVPQDYLEAYKWMNLAALRGSQSANQKRFADERDAVAKKMTPEQLGEAQKRAQEWAAEFQT